MIIFFFQESLDNFHHLPRATNGGHQVHLTHATGGYHLSLYTLLRCRSFLQLHVYWGMFV